MNVFSSTYFFIALFLAQMMLFSLCALTLQYYRLLEGTTVLFAAIFIGLNYFVAILFFRRLFQADYQAQVIQNQEGTLDKLESTLRLIRSQRHDIVNHLQTIYALLQLGDSHRAKKYVDEIQLVTNSSNQIARLDQPEVAAFLQSKLGQATARQISFHLEILTDLKECEVKGHFLIVILGNLLDNAFEAVEDLPIAERLVELEISEEEDCYQLIVTNAGPSIEENLQEKIFAAGYSTKEPGRGYGLSIVRETVLNYGGNIEVKNNPTAFIVTLPKK
ncbi:MAG: hypothetical protein PWQ96_169 [Clostridia bacterium]|jgi:hypothetical protein|nr:hypothetical protein [Clostridia bacterium]